MGSVDLKTDILADFDVEFSAADNSTSIFLPVEVLYTNKTFN